MLVNKLMFMWLKT